MTFGQLRYELHGSTYMQILFNKYIGTFFGDFLSTVKQTYLTLGYHQATIFLYLHYQCVNPVFDGYLVEHF